MTKKDTFIQFFDQEQREAESTIPISQGRASDPDSPSVGLKATFIAKSDSLIRHEAEDIEVQVQVADQSDVRLREHLSSSVEVLDVQGDG